MEKIVKSINIGVPNYIDLFVTVDELKNITDNLEKFEELLYDIENAFSSKKKYHLYDYKFINSFVIHVSSQDSQTRMAINPYDYFNELLSRLEMDSFDENFSFNSLMFQAYIKIEQLMYITSCYKLKKNFPKIKKDYDAGNILYDKACNEKDSEKRSNLYKKYYGNYGFYYKVYRFSNSQACRYKEILDNYETHVELCLKEIYRNKIANLFECVDQDKLKLLIAYKYIQYGKQMNDAKIWQEILFYLLPLRTDNSINDTMFYIGDELISKNYVERVVEFIIDEYGLVPYNAPRERFIGKSYEEVESIKKKEIDYDTILYRGRRSINSKNYSTEYEKSGIIYIPKEVTYQVPEIIIPGKVSNSEYKPSEHVDLGSYRNRYIKSQDELNRLLIRKQQLLETDDYIEKFITESMGYNGLLYFVYPNKIILRDRYYLNVLKNIIANNEAMYKLNMDYFGEIYNLSRMELTRTSNFKAKRINHDGSFEQRALAYIRQPSDEISTREAEDFVYKVKKEKVLIPTKNKNIY